MYIEPLISVKNEVSKEKLMQDLHLVMTDAEELLRATASHTGEKVSAARERIQESRSATKERLVAAQKQVTEKARQAAKVTDEYVHENPWKAVGMGAGAGLIIGMLISRGR